MDANRPTQRVILETFALTRERLREPRAAHCSVVLAAITNE
jgi:hypothetical protein